MAFQPGELTAQIDAVLGQYEVAQRESGYDDLSDLGDARLAELASRVRTTIGRLVPVGSQYLEEAMRLDGDADFHRLPRLVGILRSLRADVQAGWLTTVKELIHADTFDDFLEMAEELLAAGYEDASAVVGGSVLEAHLRLLCEGAGVETRRGDGGFVKADTLNADLVKAGVYNKNQQKQITAWLGIRNSAAHGHYDEYSREDVIQLLRSVRQILATLPA